MLGKGSDSEYSCLSLEEIDGRSPKDLFPRLVGQRLVVDARIGGLKDGLLNPSHCEFASTIENGWGDSEIPEDRPEDGAPEIRVRVLDDDARKERTKDFTGGFRGFLASLAGIVRCALSIVGGR